ncbi:MAG: protein kinase [Polyangiaceae bacterium]|nr:protein kinase [Polyangiaceae bacterium]
MGSSEAPQRLPADVSLSSETMDADAAKSRLRVRLDSRPSIPLIVGRYELSELLGRGGMGEVYAARHLDTGEEAAIKLLRPELLDAPEIVARFEREAALTSALRGPHAVRVLDFGVDESGPPYIAMERLRGIDLAQLLDKGGRLAIGDAVHWLLQACEAMAEAHDAGVIHRDLKPANLFIATTPSGPILKVLDFGISRLRDADTRLTMTQNTIGTPVYMSPEQAKNSRSVDARSDIWSLGVILYELVTNAIPFDGDSPTAIAINACTVPPTPPTCWRPDLPVELEAVILKALEKDPAQRFGNVRELAAALAPFASRPAEELANAPSAPFVFLATMPDERAKPGEPRNPTESEPAPAPRRQSRGFGIAVALAVVAGLAAFGLVSAQPDAHAERGASAPNVAAANQGANDAAPIETAVARPTTPALDKAASALGSSTAASIATTDAAKAMVAPPQTSAPARSGRTTPGTPPRATSGYARARPKFDERR